MRRFLITLAALVTSSAFVASAAFDRDMILDAMDAEIQRSMRDLKVGDLARPYHIEYLLKIRRSASVHAVLGTVEDVDSGITATLTVRVRVGGPRFDNTNFFDVSLGFFGSSDDEEGFKNRRIPFEISSDVLRRELWLATDACFKQAVEIYAKKESALKNRTRTDTTWDFAYFPGASVTSTPALPEPNVPSMVSLVERLSAVFRSYPSISSSRVGMEVVPEEVYYVNSEGRRLVKHESFTGVEIIATTQAPDGMPLAQTYAAYGSAPKDLPSADSLIRAAEATAKRLAAQVQAPTIEAYSGPVLFLDQAAAGIVGQFFAPNLVAQRPPLSEGGFSTNDRSMAFQNKIGARVLPEFLSVDAVPSRARDNGRPVAGHFVLDDEGMPAEDLTLVDKGYLRTLLSSRVPTKRVKGSNGHMRGGGAMFGVLDIRCVDKKRMLSDADLKKRLLKLVKDRDLPYGIIVRTTMDQNLLFTGVFRQLGADLPITPGEGKIGLLEAYRVYPDGREELIRGVEAAGIAPATFKDILAVSTSTTVHNFLAPSVVPAFITGGSSYLIASIITPDLLFEDCEVRPLEGDMPKPPSMTNPIAGE
jgi:predicted Zn-dependent protease